MISHRKQLRRAKRGEGMALLKEVVKDPGDDCRIWPYGMIGSYGAIRDPRTKYAHRLALILYSGRNPRHLEACHGACHNKLCCNPRHLSWLTRKENNADKVRDGTTNRGEVNGQAKLTEGEVRAIRADPRTQRIIAKVYGIGQTQVSAIKLRQKWGHLS